MAKKTETLQAASVAKSIGIGTCISMIITLIGTGLISWLTHKEMISEMSTGYGVLILLMIVSVIGGLTACANAAGNILIKSIATGFAYFLCLIGITALFFEGQYNGVGVTLLVIICGSICAALIKSRSRLKHNKRYRKR